MKRPAAPGKSPDDRPAQRLALALDMFETAEAVMRQNLRRRHPSASRGQIDRLIASWLQNRPGAEAGDAEGRLIDLMKRLR